MGILKIRQYCCDLIPGFWGRATQKISRLAYSLALLLAVISPAFGQTADSITIKTTTWLATMPANVDGSIEPNGAGCTSGDMSGSGVSDLVCINVGGDNQSIMNNLPVSVTRFASPRAITGNFKTSIVLGTTNTSAIQLSLYIGGCAIADFDGDGRSDLACFTVNQFGDDAATPTVWFSNGTSFSATPTVNTSLAVNPATDTVDGYVTHFNYDRVQPFGTSCTTGHFMAGPGTEIICDFPYTNSSATGYGADHYDIFKFVGSNYLNSVPGTVQETESQWVGPSYLFTWGKYINWGRNCLTGDFTGSGLTDVACPDGSGNWIMGISTGSSFSIQTWPTSDMTYHKDCIAADFNGDGKADIACYVDGASNPISIYLSTGSGFRPVQSWTFSGTNASGGSFSNQSWSGAGMPPPQNPDGYSTRDTSIFSTVCSVADLNGDGKADIVCYSGSSPSSTDWIYAMSTGSSFSTGHLQFIAPPVTPVGLAGIVNSNNEPFEYVCTLGDFMGNGIPDILCNLGGSTSNGSTVDTASIGIITRQ